MAIKRYGTVNRPISDMLNDIYMGRLGLPDLQRPFLWKNNKVRDLFDSLMKGYPVGYFMTWQFPDEYSNVRHIGTNKKKYDGPQNVVIDGQQRLTALFSVIYGIEVVDIDYRVRKIMISFNPSNCEFEVWSSAKDNDPRFIPDISEVFRHYREQSLVSFRRKYIERLNESHIQKGLPELTDNEIDAIESGIHDLVSLLNFELPTIEISKNVDSKEVANIFVRINSAGEKLKQNDFILTLISVYDLDMKTRIDEFCADSKIPAKATSYNNILEVKPSHIVKVVSGLAFNRAQLRYVYKKMLGTLPEDDEKGISTEAIREKNFTLFSSELDKTLDLNNWHSFLNAITGAGYIDKSFIAAENAVVYNYMLYLIGKYRFGVPTAKLNAIIRRWFFVSTITLQYTISVEAAVESQLNELKRVNKPEEFVDYLNGLMDSKMSDDFFAITLPDRFNNSSSSRNPYYCGFVASQVVLGTSAMFSTIPLRSLFSEGSSGTKCAYDKHHLFPKNYLGSIGIDDDRDRNQFANFTYIDYQTNIDISDRPPSNYMADRRARMGEDEYRKMCDAHALPMDWERMDYFDFLSERRKLMADIVRKAYIMLGTLQS